MPVIQTDYNIIPSVNPQITTIPLGFHIIENITLVDLSQLLTANSAIAYIGIMSEGQQYQNIAAICAHGYVDAFTPLVWSGNITADPGTYAYSITWNSGLTTLRLSVMLHKRKRKEGTEDTYE